MLLPVYLGDADQRRFRDLSLRATLERRSLAWSDRSQLGGASLRPPGRADVVHPGHAPCLRILCLHLPQFLRQGETRRTGPLLRLGEVEDPSARTGQSRRRWYNQLAAERNLDENSNDPVGGHAGGWAGSRTDFDPAGRGGGPTGHERSETCSLSRRPQSALSRQTHSGVNLRRPRIQGRRARSTQSGCRQAPARPRDRSLLWMLSLSLIHISEPTRRTPISYAVFCL